MGRSARCRAHRAALGFACPAHVADPGNGGLFECVMITLTAIAASDPANDALDQRIFVNRQFNHRREGPISGR